MSNITLNTDDLLPENATTETLVKNLKDYLSNESLGYGDEAEKVTYGELVIIAICEELRTRDGDFDKLIEDALFEANDLNDDDLFEPDDVTNL